jgi:hypothetical protein
MGLLSQSMKKELEKGLVTSGAPEVFWRLNVAWPDTTRRYAMVGLNQAAAGEVSEPRLLSASPIGRSIDLRSNTLAAVEFDAEVADPDFTIHKLAQKYRGSLRGIATSLSLVSPNVAKADRFTAFDGVLDAWSQPRPMAWRLRMRPNDSALQLGEIPKVIVSAADWPNADPKAHGQYAPLIYGRHDSNSVTSKGMVPTLYVDRAPEFRYLVALAWIQDVTAVYKDGTLVSTALWTKSYVTVNGTRYTLIDFNTDQGESAKITCDVKGLTPAVDGSGTYVSNPAGQMSHLLHNFVFNDYRGQAGYFGSAPVSLPSFLDLANFFAALGYEGSRWIGGSSQRKAIDVFNEWLASHNVKGYWTNAGQLAVGVLDHRMPSSVYLDDPHVLVDEWELGGISQTLDPNSVKREYAIQYQRGEADNKYFQTLHVTDLTVADKVTVNVALPWSASWQV